MYRNCFWHPEKFLYTTCSQHVLSMFCKKKSVWQRFTCKRASFCSSSTPFYIKKLLYNRKKRPQIIMILWLFQVRIVRVDAPLCRASICLSVIFLWFPQKTTCLLPFIKSVRLSTVQSNLRVKCHDIELEASNLVHRCSLACHCWWGIIFWSAWTY